MRYCLFISLSSTNNWNLKTISWFKYATTNYPMLYKLRFVQNTGTCYPGQGWFVRNLAWGRRPKARCTWQTSRGLGSMSWYSVQILICLIVFIWLFKFFCELGGVLQCGDETIAFLHCIVIRMRLAPSMTIMNQISQHPLQAPVENWTREITTGIMSFMRRNWQVKWMKSTPMSRLST